MWNSQTPAHANRKNEDKEVRRENIVWTEVKRAIAMGQTMENTNNVIHIYIT